jgi:radical SAM superfamily enzyme YgiQ (UPF0313 family)
MQVVLFNPAPRSGWQVQRRIELPLGLLSVATPLDRDGWKVRIVEEFGNRHWRKELLEALSSDTVCFGVTSMTGPQILHAIRACKIVRKQQPNLPIIWGGVHGSLLPEQTLQSGWADIVVIGEGEQTFLQLVAALAAKGPFDQIAGIAYRDNGQCRLTAERPFVDLDSQPPLSYGLLKMDHYRRRLFGIDHVSFNSSRGCTFRCAFCWDPVFYGRQRRAMQPQTVIEHLKRIVRDYGIRGFLFTDDNFFINLNRARGILEETVRSNLDISISKLQVRADTICRMDKEFLDLLVRANVKRVTVGVESGSQAMLDAIQKDLQVEQVLEANRKLMPYPIVPLFLFMMALPRETPAQFADSIALANRLLEENPRANRSFNIYTPYPGTKLYETVVRSGLQPPQRLEDWAAFNFRNIHRDAPWVEPQTRRLVQGLDFPLTFIGKMGPSAQFRKTHPLALAASKLYYPLARHRVNKLDVRFPVETKLAKALGLFARQD